MIYECVINISEGTNVDLVAMIASAGGECVRDVHSDVDHNRSVLTIASQEIEEVTASAFGVVRTAIEHLEIDRHLGVHPRLGIVDVVPFVSYDNAGVEPSQKIIEAAQNFGAKVHEEFHIPIFFYDEASSEKRTLPFIRKNAFSSIAPDLGNNMAHRTAGAMCIGAREPLVAVNITLETKDLALAQSIARTVRESSGGIKGVRAIGLLLENQNSVQVSMNIVDVVNVNTGEICEEVRAIADAHNVASSVELVGLVPQKQFEMWSHSFLNWSGLDVSCTVEQRLSHSE